jgi:hypothetical protein
MAALKGQRAGVIAEWQRRQEQARDRYAVVPSGVVPMCGRDMALPVADPRVSVPRKYGESEDFWESSLEEALWRGQVEIIRKIKIDPKLDDINQLLCYACFSKKTELAEYLISLGADINCVVADTQTPVQAALTSIEFELDMARCDFSCLQVHPRVDFLKTIARLGAKLNAGNITAVAHLRRCLLKTGPYEAYELIKSLKGVGFAEDETFLEIMRDPKMRLHLRSRAKAIARLFPKR